MPESDKSVSRWTQLGHQLSEQISRWLPPSSAQQFRIASHRTYIPNLPDALEGLRVVQLSDIHYYEYSSHSYHQQVVDTVNHLNADIIITTGDIIHYGSKCLDTGHSFLHQLKARLGKFACLGNHDYSDGHRSQGLRVMQREAGFDMLVNDAIILDIDGQPLCISGIDDCRHGTPNIEKAFQTIDASMTHLCLIHNPALAPHVAKAENAPHLVMAGHTHGGHVNHMVVNWIQRHLLDHDYQYGWFTFQEKTQLYVTSGVGSASFAVHKPEHDFHFALHPFRVNSAPEIAVFDLTGQTRFDAPAVMESSRICA